MSQADLFVQLAPAIDSGRVVVHDSDDQWVGALRHAFPVRASGIRWEVLSDARHRAAEVPRIPISDKVDALRSFLVEFGSAAGLGQDDRCVVFGDGSFEVAFELPFRDLLELFPLFFSMPQATYILSPGAIWCFVFTFEEDMYFAEAPGRKV